MDTIGSTMLYNLSQSLLSVQSLLVGLAYMIGIVFFYVGFERLLAIADFRPQSHSGVRMVTPVAYFFCGAALFYSPSMLHTLALTLFGAGNAIAYSSPAPYNVVASMKIIIRTVGLLWLSGAQC